MGIAGMEDKQANFRIKCVLIICLCVLLFLANLLFGSVHIPLAEALRILAGKDDDQTWRYIILYSRLPQALTALLAGGALAVCGLLLQTTFHNPLAAPDVFGVTGGASLAVALLLLVPQVSANGVLGHLSSVVAAFWGAWVVTAFICLLGRRVHNNVVLIIIGMMIGYLCSSGITLLNAFATEEGIRNFVAWGMGDFSSVGMAELPVFVAITVVAMASACFFVKPLNALLMGRQYAESLGVNVRRTRNLLLVITGLLTAVVTAFCGPVSFIALAVPHIARIIMKCSDHRRLLPATVLVGAAIALLCNIITILPNGGTVLPLNAVTPLIGAPVIVYVVMRR